MKQLGIYKHAMIKILILKCKTGFTAPPCIRNQYFKIHINNKDYSRNTTSDDNFPKVDFNILSLLLSLYG